MAYDVMSDKAGEFISHEEIEESLAQARADAQDPEKVRSLIAKARTFKGLTHREAATLTYVTDPDLREEMFAAAREIKEHIYGDRIVMFAPLYLSDYCVNECRYCGYHATSDMPRKRLTDEEIVAEVRALEAMGHKRLAGNGRASDHEHHGLPSPCY